MLLTAGESRQCRCCRRGAVWRSLQQAQACSSSYRPPSLLFPSTRPAPARLSLGVPYSFAARACCLAEWEREERGGGGASELPLSAESEREERANEREE
eukprot:2568262-Rhodomonas_salina.2